MSVRRTATRMADGRELIYFDDSEPYVSCLLYTSDAADE